MGMPRAALGALPTRMAPTARQASRFVLCSLLHVGTDTVRAPPANPCAQMHTHAPKNSLARRGDPEPPSTHGVADRGLALASIVATAKRKGPAEASPLARPAPGPMLSGRRPRGVAYRLTTRCLARRFRGAPLVARLCGPVPILLVYRPNLTQVPGK
jgi:hypothetical protein